MQTLEVISVNLWQILISLANLVILFLIVKFLLFKPIKKVYAQRQNEIMEQYRAAELAEQKALADKAQWEEKLSLANEQANEIIKSAADTAERRGERIVADAKDKADGIVKRAEEQAELERKKAEESIKQEIVSVSATLAEKMIGREINTDDHRDIIDSFINDIEDSNGTND